MALFRLLLGYHKEKALCLKVLTVDHGIRENSASDAAFVENVCRENGIECRVSRLNVPESAAKSKRGIEAEAHFLRKQIYKEALASGFCDLVATAHHMCDNVETVLLHLFRGCGIKGLSGMRLCESSIFRPFLHTEKEEIDAFVKAENIPFVVDETNADTSFDRNYVRHKVLPVLAARFPSCEKAIARTALIAGESVQKGTGAEYRDGVATVDENALTAENIFEALRILGKDRDVYSADILRVQSLPECKPCAKATLSGGVIAAREYGKIAFYRSDPAPAFAPVSFKSSVSAGSVQCGDAFVSIRPAEKRGNEKGALYFDMDKVPLSSEWRTRRDGDRFTPFGGGEKKLKEYLIDKKIPLRERDGLLLLCDGNQVLVIAGVEIADTVRIDGSTTNIVCVKAVER